MAELSLYTSQVPDVGDTNSPGVTPGRALAAVFKSTIDTYVVAGRWYAPTTLPSSAPKLSLWSLDMDLPTSDTGTLIEIVTYDLGSMVAGAWNRLDFAAPIALVADIPRQVQIWTPDRYCYGDPDDWPIISGTLEGYSSSVLSAGNGRFANDVADNVIAPKQVGSTGYNFFVDVITDTNPFAHGKGAEFLSFFS